MHYRQAYGTALSYILHLNVTIILIMKWLRCVCVCVCLISYNYFEVLQSLRRGKNNLRVGQLAVYMKSDAVFWLPVSDELSESNMYICHC